MSLNFLTLYGSVRTERQGIKFARFLDAQLKKRGHASTLIDPLQYRFPLLDKMYKEYQRARLPSIWKPSPISFAKPMAFFWSAANTITVFPRP